MAKKRPTLDAFLGTQTKEVTKEESAEPIISETVSRSNRQPARNTVPKKEEAPATRKPAPIEQVVEKYEVIRHMLYLPLPVYDQLQGLIFEEQRGQTKRRKTHDYLLEAIDLLFREKGLKPIAELTGKNE